jgi:hypothetical protein
MPGPKTIRPEELKRYNSEHIGLRNAAVGNYVLVSAHAVWGYGSTEISAREDASEHLRQSNVSIDYLSILNTLRIE